MSQDAPALLLAHHLKALKLPTFLRDYTSVAATCSQERSSYPQYLLQLAERELLDRAVAGCSVVFHVAADYRLWVPKPEEIYRSNVTGTRDLLLAAPAGARATIGLDPGFRTGVKLAVVDATGKLLEHRTIYPLQPQNQRDASTTILLAMMESFKVEIVAIGNGTASREVDEFISEAMKQLESALRFGTPIIIKDAERYDPMVNTVLNREYIAIKVDRDERPDIDSRYQAAVTAISGQGGWPLTAFLTSDGRPFFGDPRHVLAGVERHLAGHRLLRPVCREPERQPVGPWYAHRGQRGHGRGGRHRFDARPA